MVACQHCGEDLGFDPEEAVFESERSEVVTWVRSTQLGQEALYYCGPNCFTEAHA